MNELETLIYRLQRELDANGNGQFKIMDTEWSFPCQFCINSTTKPAKWCKANCSHYC